MKQYTVTKNEEGRRLDRFILGILKESSMAFAYKMLRKKNILLNGQRAKGMELLHSGDIVTFYLSDETFSKFSGKASPAIDITSMMPPVVYEDDDVIIVDKPAGMLTQKSSAKDVSLNEILLSYAVNKGITDSSFTPSVCNRLDRNTSGLVTFARSYKGARYLTEAFRKRTVKKYYACVCKGVITEDMSLSGKLIKDESKNTVTISDAEGEGADVITMVHPLSSNDNITLCEIQLITGKTHQIRAHLAAIGHPIIGDKKYGDGKVNARYKKEYKIDHQMLTCTRMVFPDDKVLAVSGKKIDIGIPGLFKKVM